MLHIIADTHVHSMACDHAYSTISENMAEAAKKGLRFVASTEHAESVPCSPSKLHFSNLKILPRFWNGVMLLKGAEVNIIDYAGNLDLPERTLEKLEWVIASMHTVCLEPSSEREHTAAWLAVAENPLVDVIGHCGDSRYAFNYEAGVKAFARNGKIVEINAHSFNVRQGAKENCAAVAKLCARYGVPVVVSSDAHYHGHVGRFGKAVLMLEEIGFPEELVLNADYDRFLTAARQRSGKLLTDEE